MRGDHGLLASNELCHRDDLPKPAVAPFVIDADVQEIPFANGASGAAPSPAARGSKTGSKPVMSDLESPMSPNAAKATWAASCTMPYANCPAASRRRG